LSVKSLKTVEKWIDLQNISMDEALRKLLGIDESKDEKRSKSTLLRVIIKDNYRPVAQVVMRAWKDCKIDVRLRPRMRKSGKYELGEHLIRLLISIFVIGIQEYVEYLRFRIELILRRTTEEKIIPVKISEMKN